MHIYYELYAEFFYQDIKMFLFKTQYKILENEIGKIPEL